MKCWLIKFKLTEIERIHFHPSGNPTPSSEDIDVTKRLQHAGEIIGVPVLDHLIIGDNHFISLNEKGFMLQR